MPVDGGVPARLVDGHVRAVGAGNDGGAAANPSAFSLGYAALFIVWVPRAGVQSIVAAAFGGVLVRTPLVANAFAAAMARLRLARTTSTPSPHPAISLRRVPTSKRLGQQRLGAILPRLTLIFGPTPQSLRSCLLAPSMGLAPSYRAR